MNRNRCSTVSILISHILLMATFFMVEPSSSAEFSAPLAISGTKSSSNTFTSSRHKRAPGWGKRAPRWNNMNEEFQGVSENELEEQKSIAALRAATYFSDESPFSSEKRAPGWGKRAPGWGKRAPGWGKRSCFQGACLNNVASLRSKAFPHWGKTIDDIDRNDNYVDKITPVFFKRAPGWGKRSYDVELDDEVTDKDSSFSNWDKNNDIYTDIILENPETVKELLERIASLSRAKLSPDDAVYADKRAPGWGKRNHRTEMNYEDTEIEKRAPGWGKRAPGWGKRNYEFELDRENIEDEKRAPGWGKRAPGWGKRAPGWGKRNYEMEKDDESFDLDKRAPGWGKRSFERSKKAPGWGKRSVPDSCQELQSLNGDYSEKVVRSERCGNLREANKPARK